MKSIIPVSFSPPGSILYSATRGAGPQIQDWQMVYVRHDETARQWCEVRPDDWTQVLRTFRCGKLHLVEFLTDAAKPMGVARGYLQLVTGLPEPIHFKGTHFCDDDGKNVDEAKSLLLMPGRNAYIERA